MRIHVRCKILAIPKALGSESASGRNIGIMFRETSSEATQKSGSSDQGPAQEQPGIPIDSLANTMMQVVLKLKPDAIP